MFNPPIEEQLWEHIDQLFDNTYVHWFDYLYDDSANGLSQVLIRKQSGAEDGLVGSPSYDITIVAAEGTQDASIPRIKLEEVSSYLLTNYRFSDIINVSIASGPRPAGMLSNNRPVYTMTINLLTERTEVF